MRYDAIGASSTSEERLLARPSIARVVDEARPWRKYFPLKGHTLE
jgi:hypothetical protein